MRRIAMDTANWEVDGVGTVAVALSSLLLVLFLVLAAVSACSRPATGLSGPTAYPIIGALHAMDGHRDRPFRRFAELARLYGPVYAMTMGSVPCVIVNDYPSIKEVLITNGSKFGGRPDFLRYNVLFAGDRNNCEYIKI
uniref:Cytochrome p450 n=1 Tax=Schizaphis graminum TaxID=13262 RepID=A0A2S2PVQ1_SCHGA